MIYFRLLTSDGVSHETPATLFQYPGGELHLQNLSANRDSATIWIADVRASHDSLDTDLTHAHMFANVAHQRQAPFVLMLPYLPGARSDRGEPMGAAVYSERVRAMNPQQIIGIDAHSHIIERHLDPGDTGKLTVLDPLPLLLNALHDVKYDGVISPDKGAVERAEYTAKQLGIDCYHADKEREFSTGKILSIKLRDKLPPSGKYLIVDDICDGGGTFMGLAKATELPKAQLGLWITHGIFSGNAVKLRDFYGRIMTTDSHAGHNNFGDADIPVDQTFGRQASIHIADMAVPCQTYMLQHVKKEFSYAPPHTDRNETERNADHHRPTLLQRLWSRVG